MARAIRQADAPRPTHFLTKNEFVSTLKASGLAVEGLKERAAYLPVTAGLPKLRLPVPGAFLALVSKSGDAKGGKPKKIPTGA